jgi:hypothetical protein
MRLGASCAAALVLCSAASAALPRAGTLVPDRSLAGVRIGESATQVRQQLGPSYGICRGCATTTWYYTYRKFDRRGLAVELSGGLISAVYTIWRPSGWRGPHGLRFGDLESQVSDVAGPLMPVACPNYDVLVRDAPGVRTAYYFVRGKLWGFGLLLKYANPCR